jgi:hypothetical protein
MGYDEELDGRIGKAIPRWATPPGGSIAASIFFLFLSPSWTAAYFHGFIIIVRLGGKGRMRPSSPLTRAPLT